MTLQLRPLEPTDQSRFLLAVRQSRQLHRPWVKAPDTVEAFERYCQHMAGPNNFAFLIVRRDSDALVGVINLTQVVYGNFRSAYLGYYAFAGQERQGLMRQGLQALVRHAFHVLKLHRLEANIQPGNSRSIALVRACGFVQEGYSPRYLKIGGRWRDHERWALVKS